MLKCGLGLPNVRFSKTHAHELLLDSGRFGGKDTEIVIGWSAEAGVAGFCVPCLSRELRWREEEAGTQLSNQNLRATHPPIAVVRLLTFILLVCFCNSQSNHVSLARASLALHLHTQGLQEKRLPDEKGHEVLRHIAGHQPRLEA